MNAAVDTSRTDNQRRRPLSLAHKRGGQNDVDASQPLAVLIRVPNLDAPRPYAARRDEARSEARNGPRQRNGEAGYNENQN